MSEPNELTQQDWELLEEIEVILADEGATGQEADSLYSFCAQLANTLPQADDVFRQRLEARLVAKLERQRKKVSAIEFNPQQEVHQTHTEAAHRQPSGHRWRGLRPFVAWVGVGVTILAILLAVSPGLRSAAAQAVGEIRQMLGGMFTGPDGITTFEPPLPFKVKQPGYLPEGFERTIGYYYPGPDPQTGQDRPSLREERILPKPSASTAARRAAQQVRGSEPHIVLVYEARNGQYVQLFERAAQPDQTLPPGQARTVAGQTARLRRGSQTLTLTWIDEGTWIELKGTLPETDMLQVAEGLVTTQTPGVTGGPNDEDALVHSPKPLSEPPFCDPDQRPPSWPRLELLLGEVRGQQNKGRVLIQLSYHEVVGESEGVSYSANVENIVNVREDVLEPALAALQDPATPMQRLSYPSLTFMSSGAEPCLRPNPWVQGYIVIEVWEEQVNIGYGGEGAALKERAIKALEQELRNRR